MLLRVLLGRSAAGCAVICAVLTVVVSTAQAYTDSELGSIAQHLKRGSVLDDPCGLECTRLWNKEQASQDGQLGKELLNLRASLNLMPSLQVLTTLPLDRGAHIYKWLVTRTGSPSGSRFYKLVSVGTPAPSPATAACDTGCPQQMSWVSQGSNINAGGSTVIPAPSNGYQWFWQQAANHRMTWVRLKPGSEQYCNDHPQVPSAFQIYTSSQSTWCYVGREQQVGFYPFSALSLALPTGDAAGTGVGENQAIAITPRSWDTASLKSAVATELASGNYPTTTAFYDFQFGIVPDCRGLTVSACQASLSAEGFTNTQVSVRSTAAIDFAVGADRVVQLDVPAGQETTKTTQITISANPGSGSWEQELIQRYRPELIYDNDESFRADSAEEMTDWPDNLLVRANGPSLSPPALSLGVLGYPSYADGVAYGSDDRIDARKASTLPPELEPFDFTSNDQRQSDAASQMHSDPYYADQTYARIFEGSGQIIVQHWFFYYYNPAPPGSAGFGAHEGDWEMVQFRFDGSETTGLSGQTGQLGVQPVEATASEHTFGSTCPWSLVNKRSDGVPQIDVAVDSHASYFGTGTMNYGQLRSVPIVQNAMNDSVDGDGAHVRPQVSQISGLEGWLKWRGAWGGTTGSNSLESDSPVGPAQHGTQWTDPQTWATEQDYMSGGCGNPSASSAAESSASIETLSSPSGTLKISPSVGTSTIDIPYQMVTTGAQVPVGIRFLAWRKAAPAGKILAFAAIGNLADLHGMTHLPVPAGTGQIVVRAVAYSADRRNLAIDESTLDAASQSRTAIAH